MMFPSFDGLTPRSESRIAFSIADRAVLSKGEMTIVRASGVLNEASCWRGVGAP